MILMTTAMPGHGRTASRVCPGVLLRRPERRAAMGLMDRVKEQAAQVAQRTAQATQEAAQQGKAKLDQAQAKRRADAMFRDLGAAVYAERTGRGGTDTADKIERLVTALQQQEAEQGLGDTDGPPPA